jgi:hypothetical protein
MHIATFDLSITYLKRWHTLATVRKILDENKDTPLHYRTPRWLFYKYLAQHEERHERVLRWRRPLGAFDEKEMDVALPEDVEEPSEEAHTTPFGVLTRRPRAMRHVHTREAEHVFGAHVEWLLATQHTARFGKGKLDFESWLDFAEKTLEERRREPPLGQRDEFEGQMPPEAEIAVDLLAMFNSRKKLEMQKRAAVAYAAAAMAEDVRRAPLYKCLG